MIRNKKVLLICKESYSVPLFFIAKLLQENGNDVGVFFIYPIESYYNKCIYNEYTFYKFKEDLKEVKLYGLEDVCKKYNENFKKPIIDMDYLNTIEKEYTHFKNLNLQLTSSQLTTRQYHSRIYFNYSSYKQNLYFLELSYKKVIDILNNFKPDVLLDTDDAELIRTVLNEVAYKRGIPYITINHPRYEAYKIPTYCLGLENEKYFISEYNNCFKKSPKDLSEEYSYILEMRKKSNIMSKEYYNSITSQYKHSSLINVLKTLWSKLFYFWNVYITNGNLKLRKDNAIIYPNPIKYFVFYLLVEIKKQILFRPNKYFQIPNKKDNYVYMPLHLIPESTTFVKAPYYINELDIIAQISKSLPIGWKLYVKEHQAMLGERSLDFYKKVKKFHNVKLVQLNYYNDPKPWIENAKGIITITGTSAYEAALLGKKSIIFGDVPFELIDSIYKIESYKELAKELQELSQIDNIHSCAAYLNAVKNCGYKIKLPYLINEGIEIIQNKKEMGKDYKKEINELMNFYNDAFNRYTRDHNSCNTRECQ